MVNSQEPSQTNWRIVISALAVVLIIIIMGAVAYSVSPRAQGQFGPQVIPNPPTGFVNGDPLEITFTELDANPAAYQNKLVRVSGSYTRLSPTSCIPYKGPQPHWGLIADGFQMDVVGINNILQLAPENAPLVVEGIWRLYDGPLGCGKEPERGTLWHLEARRIIEPNPLQFGGVPVGSGTDNTATITPTATITSSNTITVPVTIEAASPTPIITLSPTPSPTTITSPTFTPTATSTQTPIANTGTTTSVTATPRPGNEDNSNTPTPASTANGTATPTPTGTITNEDGTPDPTTEALATSPAGTITAPTLQPGYPSPSTPTPYP